MSNVIEKIPLAQLTPHPGNPNRMSKATFAKLLRNIEQTGRYEPLIIRPYPKKVCHSCESRNPENNEPRTMNKEQRFQIINGEHRWRALKQLGKKQAEVIVWDIDDDQADILLATLNRLCGRDMLDKKLVLLKRLSEKAKPAQLAKLLPQTKAQIEKLTNLHLSRVSLVRRSFSEGGSIAEPLVFFVSDSQQQIIETAIDNVIQNEKSLTGDIKAAKRAAALTCICQYYLDHKNDQRVTRDD